MRSKDALLSVEKTVEQQTGEYDDRTAANYLMVLTAVINDLAILDFWIGNSISPDELTYYANRALVMTYKELSWMALYLYATECDFKEKAPAKNEADNLWRKNLDTPRRKQRKARITKWLNYQKWP